MPSFNAMQNTQANIVFLWHMHQPDYRDVPDVTGRYRQPWVYLHAIKDWADMAHHLERHPGVHAVVNISGVMLEQLEDYTLQLESGRLRDPLLELLGTPARPLTTEERLYIGEQCLRIKRETMLRPYAGYAALEERVKAAEEIGPSLWARFDDQIFWDLLVWYHLAWCGESIKREHDTIRKLMAKGGGFTHGDRAATFAVVRQIVLSILPRYRALAASGQIELSLTPWGHPIAPLLIDNRCALTADPSAELPDGGPIPDGVGRVQWHIRESQALFERVFGMRPIGIWPAEASLNLEFAELIQKEGFRWIASTESILKRSLGEGEFTEQSAANAWTLGADRGTNATRLFFRKERLSDFLGFEYGQRPAADAVAHFLGGIREVLASSSASSPVVSIILDGENAWEHYPDNAYVFFDRMYESVESARDFATRTYGQLLPQLEPRALPTVASGSWVMDGFSMWIGDARRNRAWALVHALEHAAGRESGLLQEQTQERVRKLLARCESSDNFWWLGFDDPRNAVREFDAAFRSAIAQTYRALGVDAPAEVGQALSRTGELAAAPVSIERLAEALAECQGMRMQAELPEGLVEWTLETHEDSLGRYFAEAGAGWLFALPDFSATEGDVAGVFKYAEIKIALEKANQRYFEGLATLTSGRTLPGLLVLGVDESSARHLAQRFRLPVVALGVAGGRARLVTSQ